MSEENTTPAKSISGFYIENDLMREARNATNFLSGPPVYLNLSLLASTALRNEIDRLKDIFNGGKDFPDTDQPVRVGRPVRR